MLIGFHFFRVSKNLAQNITLAVFVAYFECLLQSCNETSNVYIPRERMKFYSHIWQMSRIKKVSIWIGLGSRRCLIFDDMFRPRLPLSPLVKGSRVGSNTRTTMTI